jgi:hypothetical protein
VAGLESILGPVGLMGDGISGEGGSEQAANEDDEGEDEAGTEPVDIFFSLLDVSPVSLEEPVEEPVTSGGDVGPGQ